MLAGSQSGLRASGARTCEPPALLPCWVKRGLTMKPLRGAASGKSRTATLYHAPQCTQPARKERGKDRERKLLNCYALSVLWILKSRIVEGIGRRSQVGIVIGGSKGLGMLGINVEPAPAASGMHWENVPLKNTFPQHPRSYVATSGYFCDLPTS